MNQNQIRNMSNKDFVQAAVDAGLPVFSYNVSNVRHNILYIILSHSEMSNICWDKTLHRIMYDKIIWDNRLSIRPFTSTRPHSRVHTSAVRDADNVYGTKIYFNIRDIAPREALRDSFEVLKAMYDRL